MNSKFQYFYSLKDKLVDSPLSLYVCAVIAACHTEIYTCPLDLVKTRIQIQGTRFDKIGRGPEIGMLKTLLAIIKNNGILGLWDGINAIWARHSIYSGTRIIVYNKVREFFQKKNPGGVLKTWHLIICGLACGFIAQFIASPADLVKVRLMMEGKRKELGLPPRVLGFWDTFFHIYKVGGLKGLWLGWIPNVQRAGAVNLGDYTTYDIAKTAIRKRTNLSDNILLHSLASVCAGLATCLTAAIISTPADMIKSRIMNQPVDRKGIGLLYKGTWDCVKKSIKREGFLALYKGLIPSWFRLGPWAVIYWISYEQLRILVGGKAF